MAPTQLSGQCLDFWERQIELPHLKHVASAESFAVCNCQVMR